MAAWMARVTRAFKATQDVWAIPITPVGQMTENRRPLEHHLSEVVLELWFVSIPFGNS